MNFHFDVFARMGYEAQATRSRTLPRRPQGRRGRRRADLLVEDIALVGPKEKIRDDLEAWRESIATSLLVSGDSATLRTMAELVL